MKEGKPNSNNNISAFSRGLMIAFAASLLVSVYLLFTLPSDLRFKGNLQYLDLVTPILVKLYIALGVTVALACFALYAEMKNTKVVIVLKEKSAAQSVEEKIQSESNRLDSLDSTSITSKDAITILTSSLNLIGKSLNAVAGACYTTKEEENVKYVELISGYALPLTETDVLRFNFGEGLVGQAAKSGSAIYVDEIPEGYIQAVSGLGQSSPRFILILPLKKNNEVKGVLEVATFKAISPQEKQMAEKFAGEIGARLS